MIPKIIHYCWFGGAPKSKLIKKCIKSWSKYCDDYTIIEWNENNFDINTAPLFVRQAYQHKKWAFVTDYVRLKVVYENGGVYFDTDVELLKNIDRFLHDEAFFGFNDDNRINTGLAMGAIKGCPLLADLMENYYNESFIKSDGTLNMLDNTSRDSVAFEKLGLKFDNSLQKIGNYVFYPSDYFCPMDHLCFDLKCTENTTAIHHFAASWVDISKRSRRRGIIKLRYRRFVMDLRLVKEEKGAFRSLLFVLKNWIRIFR